MEADTALVGAYGVVVLHAVAHVGLYLTLVVHPCDTERVDAVGDTETFDEVYFVKLGVLVVLFFDCAEYFFYCLMVFRLTWEAPFEVFQYFFCVHNLCFFCSFDIAF